LRPLAWSKSGLPIGVQFVGRFGDEHFESGPHLSLPPFDARRQFYFVLQLAAQMKAESWNKKRPPVYG